MYHYNSSGLDNVWLKSGYRVHQTAYGEGVSIDDVGGLHRMLASRLANKPGPINQKELRFLRVHLNLSQDGLAKLVGVDAQTVSLWERRKKLPLAAETVVRMLVLEVVKSGTAITQVIERINSVERLVHQRIVATEGRRAWRTEVQDASNTSDQANEAMPA